MEKLAVLSLDGDLEQGFKATLEIYSEDQQFPARIRGQLPAAPKLAAAIHQWCDSYRNLGLPSQRIKLKKIEVGFEHECFEHCRRSALELNDHLVHWLNSETFLPVDRRLRKTLNGQDVIRVLICTEDLRLQQLPWHQWHFFQDYPHSEYALSHLNAEQLSQPLLVKDKPVVRILAILGDASGIKLEADRRFLEELKEFGAEVKFLQEPRRQEVSNQLWEQSWDVLFFAGHSRTEGGKGWIDLNAQESLSLDELKGGLRRAIAHGLQLAIFNSCDGLGLARELEHLHIPQLIVMRQPVPDRIAHRFLHLFLNAYVGGKSLYLAVREARERLEENLQEATPCASWLPVIYQNAAEVPPTWERLRTGGRIGGNRWRKDGMVVDRDARAHSCPDKRTYLRLQTILLVAFIVSSSIMGIRWLGWLEPLELLAYDRLMQLRPVETPDPRILLVEITDADVKTYGNPISDQILAQAIEKIQTYDPHTVGLNLHRYQPRGEGRGNLIHQFQQHSNLSTVCEFSVSDMDEDEHSYSPPPEFFENFLLSQLGFSNIFSDEEKNYGTVRRQLLTYNVQAFPKIPLCNTPNSFSSHLAYQFLREEGIAPLPSPSDDQWQFWRFILRRLDKRSGGYQNLKGDSNEILINYRTTDRPAPRVTLLDVLQHRVNGETVQGRLVIIGRVDKGTTRFSTPIGEMPSLWIHAHMASQLISAVLDKRPLIYPLTQWMDAIWVLACSLGVGVVVLWLRFPPFRLVAVGLMLLGLYQLSLWMLGTGIWMPLLPSVLAMLMTIGLLMIYVTVQRRK